MEFVNGVKEKRVLDIREVLEGEYEGKEIRMNGAVHTIRHMGEVAFVILRKSRGLVQCVYEGLEGRERRGGDGCCEGRGTGAPGL